MDYICFFAINAIILANIDHNFFIAMFFRQFFNFKNFLQNNIMK